MLKTLTLAAATVTSGLAAGLFYTYSYSIMVGLGRSDDRTFVTAMQWFNATITNVWFAIAFVGAPLLIVASGALHLRGGGGALPWIVAALVLYLAVVGITAGVHIPLNTALAAAGDPASLSAADLAGVRERFESTWVRWNVVRSVGSIAAFACCTWALVISSRALP